LNIYLYIKIKENLIFIIVDNDYNELVLNIYQEND